MSRTRIPSDRKLHLVRESLLMFWRAGYRKVTTRQLLGHICLTPNAPRSAESIAIVGRTEFRHGSIERFDDDRVEVSYARGVWTLREVTGPERLMYDEPPIEELDENGLELRGRLVKIHFGDDG